MNREKTIAKITYELPALDDAGLAEMAALIARLPKRDLSEEALARAQFERDKRAARVEDFNDFLGGWK